MYPRRVAILAVLTASSSWAQSPKDYDLSQASLEDLMNIQVTSVSKKEQKLSKTGAAIFVITQEDIRRSGATNIPDLLRLAPGVDVAQVDANRWAISIRGFNDQYANKVLVLIDGRSVYSPSFSRRLLGHGGCAAGGYRAHRSDPGAGRNGVGRQRRKRRHQYHYQERARPPRAA